MPVKADAQDCVKLLNFCYYSSAKPKPPETAAAAVAAGAPGRPAGGTTGGKYVPPNQRGGPEGRRGDSMASRFNARDG